MYNPIVWLLLAVIDVYIWVVIAAVIVNWLIAFNVINTQNQFVRSVVQVLYGLTEPVFKRVRAIVPAVSGIDLSPIIVVFGLAFLKYIIAYYGLYL